MVTHSSPIRTLPKGKVRVAGHSTGTHDSDLTVWHRATVSAIPACYQTAHGFCELRVHFVRDEDHIRENLLLVEFALTELQGAECGDLEHSRFLNEHDGGVTLRMPYLSVRGSGDGGGPICILSIAQTGNQVEVQPR
jgi:hypothetical protein